MHLTQLGHEADCRTLCGLSEVQQRVRGWFALIGCKKCARAATRLGIAVITDTDGERINLSEYSPI